MVRVVTTGPPASPAEIAPPKLADATNAATTQWESFRGEDGATLAQGCVASPIPGWVEDMRPAIEGRTIALAGATAEKIVLSPIDAREKDGILVLRRASDVQGPIVGTARAFLGFDRDHVVSCIAVCASTMETRGCDATVARATLEGSLPPPPPGFSLSAITWAVHHPHPVAIGGAVLLVTIAASAIFMRRRPRFRARSTRRS